MEHPIIKNNDDPLFELLPNERLSSQQKAFRPAMMVAFLPMYQLLREPNDLGEINWDKNDDFCIWREKNGTLICIGDYHYSAFGKRYLSFTITLVEEEDEEEEEDDIIRRMNVAILGENDAAIAETVTWFWSFQLGTRLYIGGSEVSKPELDFDFAALSPKQLAHILNSNPTRCIFFEKLTLTAEQSVILATRPYPMNLELTKKGRGGFEFNDNGTAFVDALEKRHSSFGSLCMTDPRKFSIANMKRLLKWEIFEKLKVASYNKELILLPLATKVPQLIYEMDAKLILQPDDFDLLQIATRDLNIKIYLDGVVDRNN